jgi:excisionase family DNA binding protein
MMSHRTDPYAVLGVARTATRAQIRAAYRRLARAMHPDASRDPSQTRKFAQVSQAWAILGDAARRRAYDEGGLRGRFAAPGTTGPSSYQVEDHAPLYHSDLGHHSDFYQAGDPLTVAEAAALVRRHPSWLRAAIRARRLPASREGRVYLLRRRDVERLDRTAPRRSRAARTPDPIPGASAMEPEPEAGPPQAD